MGNPLNETDKYGNGVRTKAIYYFFFYNSSLEKTNDINK